ncbi:porin [Poseidonocella sp. HB161398]|uniref:porin n=1 Tax=Poseidonocella sp. HB161398 TaxID=2320855 RepID=UPI0011083CDC|nr:porin [Poseidonocella sp. HB161398]
MKKILLASSALVLVGGAAAAEVTLSGTASMGLYGGETKIDGSTVATVPSTTDDDPQFWTDLDVTFDLSGETDGGVTFGASIDLSDVTENGGIQNDRDSDFAVFVSGDFGTFTMGDTDGAFDWAMQDTNFGLSGTLNDNEEHLGYQGMNLLDGFYDGQIARYDYAFDAFAIGVSAEIDDDAGETGDDGGYDDPMLGIGAKYTLDLASGSINFGAAYQGVNDDVYVAGLSAAATFGGLSAGLAYFAGEVNGFGLELNDAGTQYELTASNDAAGDDTVDIEYIGGSLAYTFDAITVGANAGTYDVDGLDDLWGAGLVAAYDLGGGLELQAGYGYGEAKNDDGVKLENSSYSFGVAMEF